MHHTLSSLKMEDLIMFAYSRKHAFILINIIMTMSTINITYLQTGYVHN